MATQSIRIPVELEIKGLQNEVAQMKKMLAGLKPDSKAFNQLSKAIEKIDHNLISLENRANQTFSSQSEITSFAKSFDKVGLAIQDVYSEFKRIDFKDLQLDPNDSNLKQIKNLENGIKNIEKKINSVDSEIFSDGKIISPDTIKTLKSLSSVFDPATASLEESANTIKKKIDEIVKQIAAADAQMKRLNERQQKAEKDLNQRRNEQQIADTNNRAARNDRVRLSQAQKTNNLEAGLDLAYKYNLADAEIKKVTSETFKKLDPEKQQIKINDFFNALNITITKAVQKTVKTLGEASSNLQIKLDEIEGIELEIQENQTQHQNLVAVQDNLQRTYENLGVGQQAAADKVNIYKQEITDLINKINILVDVLQHNNNVVKAAEKGAESASNTMSAVGDKCQQSTEGLNQMTAAAERLINIQNAIRQWFGFNEVINLTKRAVRDAISHIRELDAVMTEIAVVTDMTQAELWDQIDTYSAMAQQYGVTTVGVYQVSQLWAQQGIEMNQVLSLTEETLKMAKIANLDYADATDYMTSALRGFKLELTDAQSIVDVYSNLAAITASDTEELAVAMSKTASSAEAVGSSFENTSAMIALMVETTREAPKYFWVTKK